MTELIELIGSQATSQLQLAGKMAARSATQHPLLFLPDKEYPFSQLLRAARPIPAGGTNAG